jgi:hypothetical protein
MCIGISSDLPFNQRLMFLYHLQSVPISWNMQFAYSNSCHIYKPMIEVSRYPPPHHL